MSIVISLTSTFRNYFKQTLINKFTFKLVPISPDLYNFFKIKQQV